MACNCDAIVNALAGLDATLSTKLSAIEDKLASIESKVDNTVTKEDKEVILAGIGDLDAKVSVVDVHVLEGSGEIVKVGVTVGLVWGLIQIMKTTLDALMDGNSVLRQIIDGIVGSLGTIFNTLLTLGTWELMSAQFEAIQQNLNLGFQQENNNSNRNYQQIKDSAGDVVNGVKAELQQTERDIAGNLDSELNDLSYSIGQSIDGVKNEINGRIAELDGKVDVVSGKVDATNTNIDNKTSEINTNIDDTQSYLKGQIDSSSAALDGKLDTINTDLSNKITSETNREISAISSEGNLLAGKIDQVSAKIDDLDVTATIPESLTRSIENIQSDVNAIDATTAATNNTVNRIETAVQNIENSTPVFNDSNIINAISNSSTATLNKLTEMDAATTAGIAGLAATAATIALNGQALTSSLNSTRTKLDTMDVNMNQCCNTIQTGQGTDRAKLELIHQQTISNGTNIAANSLGIVANGGMLTQITSWWSAFNTNWQKFTNWIPVGRAMDTANLVMNVHNGIMLSRNLGETIGSTIDISLQALGLQLQDIDGNQIGFTELIGNTLTQISTNAIGLENTIALRNKLAFANRIYQSSMNAIYNIQSVMDSTKNIAETTAQYTGLIGNALKRSGAVMDSCYNWMNTDFSFIGQHQQKWQKLYTAIEDTENAVSAMGAVASEVISIKDTVRELAVNRKELEAYMALTRNGEYQYDAYGNPITEQFPGFNASVSLLNGDITLAKYTIPEDERLGQLQATIDSQSRITINPTEGLPE
jgi:hypothetical protein